jgi:hypothetical protein
MGHVALDLAVEAFGWVVATVGTYFVVAQIVARRIARDIQHGTIRLGGYLWTNRQQTDLLRIALSVDQILHEVQSKNLPVTIVVNNQEDRQILEALFARHPIVKYRMPNSKRRSKEEIEHDARPTALERIMRDHDDLEQD